MNQQLEDKSISNRLELFFILILLTCGAITFIMSFFVPMEGGGMSLMIVLTSPVFFGLSVVFSLLHFWAFKKNQSRELLFILFGVFSMILLLLSFGAYPYQ